MKYSFPPFCAKSLLDHFRDFTEIVIFFTGYLTVAKGALFFDRAPLLAKNQTLVIMTRVLQNLSVFQSYNYYRARINGS